MLKCIQECPEDDQATYASGLPGTCGETLFPDLDIPVATTTASSSTSTPTGNSDTKETETPASDINDSGGGKGAAAGLIAPTWMLGAAILGVGIVGL